MWKKRILCLVLVLCAALVMTACKQKETFPTTPQELTTDAPQDEQNIFGDTPIPQAIQPRRKAETKKRLSRQPWTNRRLLRPCRANTPVRRLY